MKIPLSIISRMCFLSILLAAGQAFSATVVVGTCMPNKVSYDSLTDAVQGVPPGSTIQVCPGTYAEQVVINKSLTLKGIASGNSAYPVIVPPGSGLTANAVALNVNSFFPNVSVAAQIVIQSGALSRSMALRWTQTAVRLFAMRLWPVFWWRTRRQH